MCVCVCARLNPSASETKKEEMDSKGLRLPLVSLAHSVATLTIEIATLNVSPSSHGFRIHRFVLAANLTESKEGNDTREQHRN